MKTFVQILGAALAYASTAATQSGGASTILTTATMPQLTTATVPSASGLPSPPRQTGCPTVTSTREFCSTCIVPACIQLATLTRFCSCPGPVPTVYLDFPCASSCSGLWCATSYGVIHPSCPSNSDGGSTVSTTATSPGGSGSITTSFPGPSLSFPPNRTSSITTTRPDLDPTSPTLRVPPINAAGRPRPFRFWL
ncbi:hypothetical protein RB594_006795 [Gaeumannomyces avenae]